MQKGEPSRTAMMGAEARGTHRLHDDPPWVLDDPFAYILIGPEWPEIAAASRAFVRPELSRRGRAGVVARSRYAEDRLVDGPIEQYVVLGAGLDSFAWRRPDLLRRLRVFEVDHPASQAWKRERAAALALPADDRHVFVPVDFEVQTLQHGLDAAGFDWSRPTVFCCVGVSMYLTGASVETSLRTVAQCAPGSEVVWSYNPAPEYLDDMGREFLEAVSQRVAAVGEPLRSFLAPAEAEALMARCGLEVVDHPTADDLVARYFADRSDGLRPYTTERLLTARPPAAG